MESHFVKNDLRFSSGKMLVSQKKQKLLKPEFMRDTWLTSQTQLKYFVLKSCKKHGVVLFLLFYFSQRRGLLLQSMQNSSNCRVNIR